MRAHSQQRRFGRMAPLGLEDKHTHEYTRLFKRDDGTCGGRKTRLLFVLHRNQQLLSGLKVLIMVLK